MTDADAELGALLVQRRAAKLSEVRTEEVGVHIS
jgi:hypothetical protein